MVTYQRLLPDAALLGKAILEQSGAPCSPDVPANLLKYCPRFTFYRTGSGAVSSLLDRATCQCIAWGTSYVQARDLAETGRTLFWQAWQSTPQFMTADGWACRIDEVSAPTETRTEGQPDGVWRFDATYTLWVRPLP
jgi:hypothetical protein